MKIKKEEIGKEFYDALEKMIEIRKEKRKIYNDSYLEDECDFLILQISNKLKRINLHLSNSTMDNVVEKAEDNALDIAVYALFLANNLIKKSEVKNE